jgi:hypothetical protein
LVHSNRAGSHLFKAKSRLPYIRTIYLLTAATFLVAAACIVWSMHLRAYRPNNLRALRCRISSVAMSPKPAAAT